VLGHCWSTAGPLMAHCWPTKKIHCANWKNVKEFEYLAFSIQNSKFSVELSCLENFNWKLKINLKVKLLAHCQTHTSTFIFISSFQLKISRHDNSTLNLEFCIENARDSNYFTFFQFAQ
jgi:hypothetical protein